MDNEKLKKFTKELYGCPFIPAVPKWQFLSIAKLHKEGFDREAITRGLQDLTDSGIIYLFKIIYPTAKFYSSKNLLPENTSSGIKKAFAKVLQSFSSASFPKTLIFIFNHEKIEEFIGEKPQITGAVESVFDDETATIKINGIPIKLPSHNHEHYFCRTLFSRLPGESVDWANIYEEMSGYQNFERYTKHDNDKRKVYDTYLRINKRILKMTGIQGFFSWETKSLRRNY